MTFCSFFRLFLLLARCPKSTFNTKIGYFGTYGAFPSFSLVQARTSSKKVCAGLLMQCKDRLVRLHSRWPLLEKLLLRHSRYSFSGFCDMCSFLSPFLDRYLRRSYSKFLSQSI